MRLHRLSSRIRVANIARWTGRKLVRIGARFRDTHCRTFMSTPPSPTDELFLFLGAPSADKLRAHSQAIEWLTERYMAHRFDLLGSGWVLVDREKTSDEPVNYQQGEADGETGSRSYNPNMKEARYIRQLLSPCYTAIDWHQDFRTGYRWPETAWYRDIRFGHVPGVDIKVPWELARMQHLPLLAWSHLLANDSSERDDFALPPAEYSLEFRNEVLDFIASNPPRLGVNWASTMDVAIRVANWLIAYDLFHGAGIEFDPPFYDVFRRSIYEHGHHIASNLEWDPFLRGNHYLADIAGLLFVAAYLPRSTRVDAWLAFAVQELISEVEAQFHEDGSHFEASTCYHRLSAEIVVWATALVLGLPSDKQDALTAYNHRMIRGRVTLAPAPITRYRLPDGRETPFPQWYIERLERMARFTMQITGPNGQVPQIGDNDSGRFIMLHPTTWVNESSGWIEDHLDHRALVAAANGLFRESEMTAFTGENAPETHLIERLANGNHLPVLTGGTEEFGPEKENGRSQIPTCFPGIGLYTGCTRRLFMVIRCGEVGQKGLGGHSHNDQLSFSLWADGQPVVVDPGTYCYTADPKQRNHFRSTRMHSTLALPDREQNPWPKTGQVLFRLPDSAKAEMVMYKPHLFIGKHTGYPAAHTRTLRLSPSALEGHDECETAGERLLSFPLAPDISVVCVEDMGVRLRLPDESYVRLWGSPGTWTVEEYSYSPGYGQAKTSAMVRMTSVAPRIAWRLELEGKEW